MIEDIKYLCNEVIIIKSGQILKVAHSNEIASLASGRVYKIPERELSNLKSPFYIENYLIRDNEKNEKIVKVLLLGDISNMEKYSAWDNILIVSHFDLVKREGGSISIYNLETKELNNIELGHDVEQMTINENVIYILSDKIIYQYELKDMNLYLKCKTQIKKSNEENYLSGIFYIKPESMKFTL